MKQRKTASETLDEEARKLGLVVYHVRPADETKEAPREGVLPERQGPRAPGSVARGVYPFV